MSATNISKNMSGEGFKMLFTGLGLGLKRKGESEKQKEGEKTDGT